MSGLMGLRGVGLLGVLVLAAAMGMAAPEAKVRPRLPGDQAQYLMVVPAMDAGFVLCQVTTRVEWANISGRWVLLKREQFEYGGDRTNQNYENHYFFEPDGAQRLIRKRERADSGVVIRHDDLVVQACRADGILLTNGQLEPYAQPLAAPYAQVPGYEEFLKALEHPNPQSHPEAMAGATAGAKGLRDGAENGLLIVRNNKGMCEWFEPAKGIMLAGAFPMRFSNYGMQAAWFVRGACNITPCSALPVITDPDGKAHTPGWREIADPF
ncbi:MAG TPA: hypothetical protein PK794_12870 [Armatimonadota bacterium]|nr:hypothetical protein [Armatimonadota bacterium]